MSNMLNSRGRNFFLFFKQKVHVNISEAAWCKIKNVLIKARAGVSRRFLPRINHWRQFKKMLAQGYNNMSRANMVLILDGNS